MAKDEETSEKEAPIVEEPEEDPKTPKDSEEKESPSKAPIAEKTPEPEKGPEDTVGDAGSEKTAPSPGPTPKKAEEEKPAEEQASPKTPQKQKRAVQKQKRISDRELDDYLKEKEAILGEEKEEGKEKKEEATEKETGEEETVGGGETKGTEQAEQEPMAEMLVPEESYLTAGVHIGTQQKSAHMKPFLYRVRNDGLFVLNVKLTDEKIYAASKFLSRFSPDEILVVSARQYGQRPVKKMAKALGNIVIPGRFVPGTLTNPNISQYIEPRVMVVTDPAADAQAMREAISVGIPIVGICDANNLTRYVDLIIPGNNKGRKALALIYYLLARTILKEKGELTELSEFSYQLEDFEESL